MAKHVRIDLHAQHQPRAHQLRDHATRESVFSIGFKQRRGQLSTGNDSHFKIYFRGFKTSTHLRNVENKHRAGCSNDWICSSPDSRATVCLSIHYSTVKEKL